MKIRVRIKVSAVLAKKIEKIAQERKCSIDEAFLFLVEKVCTPSR